MSVHILGSAALAAATAVGLAAQHATEAAPPPKETPATQRSVTQRVQEAHLRTGLWAANIETRQERQILHFDNTKRPGYCAVSRDTRMLAVTGIDETEAALVRNAGPNLKSLKFPPGMTASKVAIGRNAASLRIVWRASPEQEQRHPPGHGVVPPVWSFGGKRVLIYTGSGMLVVDPEGNAFHLTDGDELSCAAQAQRGPPPVGPDGHVLVAAIHSNGVAWAGKSDTAVVAYSMDRVLRVLDVVTGARTVLCPCPPTYKHFESKFVVSDDMSAAAFFTQDGLWLWRRGKAQPAVLAPGRFVCGAISGDGRLVAALARHAQPLRKPYQLRLYDTQTGKLVWEREPDERGVSLPCFSSDGTRVAWHDWQYQSIRWSPTDKLDERIVARDQQCLILVAHWSADGKEIVYRRIIDTGGQPGVIIIPR